MAARVHADVDEVVEALDEHGYAIVEAFLPRDEALAMRAELSAVLDRTPTGRNDFEGFSTRRVYALFAKTRVFDAPAIDPLIVSVLDRVLGSSHQFSAPVGIDIGPGEEDQVLHRDDSVYPLPWPHSEVVVNTMWALDDFSEANGATRVIAGSHRWPAGRQPAAGDPVVLAEMPAGSVMIYRGSVFHGGGANRTEQARLGVILEYVATWLRAQENHILAVPPEIVRTLPERLQEYLGYNVHPPFLGYVDGRHPRKSLEGSRAEPGPHSGAG